MISHVIILKLEGGVKMVPIKETPSYIFLSVILSQDKPFTITDISDVLDKEKISINGGKLKKALKSLCDNWVITKEGSYYSTNNESS